MFFSVTHQASIVVEICIAAVEICIAAVQNVQFFTKIIRVHI